MQYNFVNKWGEKGYEKEHYFTDTVNSVSRRKYIVVLEDKNINYR